MKEKAIPLDAFVGRISIAAENLFLFDAYLRPLESRPG